MQPTYRRKHGRKHSLHIPHRNNGFLCKQRHELIEKAYPSYCRGAMHSPYQSVTLVANTIRTGTETIMTKCQSDVTSNSAVLTWGESLKTVCLSAKFSISALGFIQKIRKSKDIVVLKELNAFFGSSMKLTITANAEFLEDCVNCNLFPNHDHEYL